MFVGYLPAESFDGGHMSNTHIFAHLLSAYLKTFWLHKHWYSELEENVSGKEGLCFSANRIYNLGVVPAKSITVEIIVLSTSGGKWAVEWILSNGSRICNSSHVSPISELIIFSSIINASLLYASLIVVPDTPSPSYASHGLIILTLHNILAHIIAEYLQYPAPWSIK